MIGVLSQKKKQYMREYISRIEKIDSDTLGVFIWSILLFLIGSIYLVHLYLSYQLNGADFGSYVHMFSTTVSGDSFLNFGRFGQNLHPWNSYWGEHFSVTLLLFVPVFALVPHPVTLLVVKSFVLAASIPIFWFLTREITSSRTLSAVLVFSYSINPFLWSAWTFDFQEQILIPVLVFSSYYFYKRNWNTLSIVCLALILLTNEFLVYIVFGYISGIALSEYKNGKLRTQLPYISIGYLLVGLEYIISGYIMSLFSRSSGLQVATLSGVLQNAFAQNTVSLGTLIVTMLNNPDLILASLFSNFQTKVLLLGLLLLPIGFLALFDEISVGAILPFLAFAWLFAGRPHFYMFGAHYPLYLLPFIYIGATQQLSRLTSSFTIPELSSRAVFQIFVILLIVSSGVAVAGSGEESGIHLPVPAEQTDHTRTIDAAIDEIPATAPMVTQNNLYPKVAGRINARYIVRPDLFYDRQELFGTYTPEYILFDLQSDPFWADRVIGSFSDRLGTEYGLWRYEDGIYIFKHGYTGETKGITSDDQAEYSYNADDFVVEAGSRNNDVIQAVGSREDRETIWFGPYIILPAGEYEAQFYVNVESESTTPVGELEVTADQANTIIAEEEVSSTDGWENVTIRFRIEELTRGIEFRGLRTPSNGDLMFRYVQVYPI